MIDHFWTISSHSISELPLIKKAIAHANGIPKPTYPKYKVGGWITKAGSCSTGFMSAPLGGGTGKIVWNGLDVNNKKSKNSEKIFGLNLEEALKEKSFYILAFSFFSSYNFKSILWNGE